jgi:hypothetical protein
VDVDAAAGEIILYSSKGRYSRGIACASVAMRREYQLRSEIVEAVRNACCSDDL